MLGRDEIGRRQPCRRVRTLLWNEIAALLNPGERDVVRKTIGPAMIEDNEVLFREALAYEEILQFVDEDMQWHIASHKILDTPARQMLEKEIKLLVQHIQQSTGCEQSNCGDDDAVSSCYDVDDTRTETESAVTMATSNSPHKAVKDPLTLNGKCKNTLDYVLSKNAIQEKQKSKNPSQFPPCGSGIYKRGSTAGSSRVGADSEGLRKVAVDPSLIVRKIAPYLNVTGIDAISDRLRHAFAAEHEALLGDVEFLRNYLEDSADVYSSVKNNPPTINEMKDCGRKLEETWAALKHCQNIQSILSPMDSLQGGTGAEAIPLTPSSSTTIPTTTTAAATPRTGLAAVQLADVATRTAIPAVAATPRAAAGLVIVQEAAAPAARIAALAPAPVHPVHPVHSGGGFFPQSRVGDVFPVSKRSIRLPKVPKS